MEEDVCLFFFFFFLPPSETGHKSNIAFFPDSVREKEKEKKKDSQVQRWTTAIAWMTAKKTTKTVWSQDVVSSKGKGTKNPSSAHLAARNIVSTPTLIERENALPVEAVVSIGCALRNAKTTSTRAVSPCPVEAGESRRRQRFNRTLREARIFL